MQDSWNILYRTIYNCTDGAYPCQYKGCEVSDGKLSLCRYKKILARMYELGMTPVLPAFSGNVPAALKSVFPAAKIERLGNWFTVGSDPRWCCTYLLDATDPSFIEIGKAFIKQQLKVILLTKTLPL
ncbi:alpha-N-acetylglucosaminidase-like isoform X2 [Daucus carota subsp. sativus]|uniref:alpha-N-acetylglucosaminidase-like isoform X2 n=1 Tax=Daucus carota subsp. sativus TaxID=79200 RepID=UPI0007EEFE21|nr:PREDICTED: alpha-N-acetylglucosaminidase-like isoform X2 [Daucus carota subsp. sativus]XP_017218871.1 PREDICTED: alpha-N-acetylglucosaminidase-like isoform X2 [Daucus carota subsp. sativus]